LRPGPDRGATPLLPRPVSSRGLAQHVLDALEFSAGGGWRPLRPAARDHQAMVQREVAVLVEDPASRFTIRKQIGSGYYGSVYAAEMVGSGREVAVKKIQMRKLADVAQLENEVKGARDLIGSRC